jgi:DNA-binding NarL/FixJ family response regulator
MSGVLVAGIAAAMGADVAADLQSGLPASHFAIHVAVVAMVASYAAHLVRLAARQRGRAAEIGKDLTAARHEAERWRSEAVEAIRGFGVAIDQQLSRWQLTEAERQVAVLLLKGLSHKEIAQGRQTTEQTVRQQALALYRKAGLGGRSELAAFFLSDVLSHVAAREAMAKLPGV